MSLGKKGRIWLVAGIIVTPLLIVLGGWGSVLASADTMNYPLTMTIPWPVLCSLKGCVTTFDWNQNWQARIMFSQVLKEDSPLAVDALTTVARHHLVNNAVVRESITLEDAKAYREEILQADDAQLILDTTGLTLEEYDAVVLKPLLQQEALRRQRKVESGDELFQLLAKDQWIIALPFNLKWDKGQAKVVAK